MPRAVATQSIATNRAKKSSDEPRSFSATITTREKPQASEDGAEELGVGQVHGAEAPGEVRQQLALLDQVAGEEHGEDDLGQLAGLEAWPGPAGPRCGRR